MLLSSADARVFRPWKNGGGETAELLASPAGAGFDDFHWRISTAKVAKSGPFSVFPGVMRSLTLLEGGPMRLRFANGHCVTLGPGDSLDFPGDLGCEADLLGADVLDLNVMTRAPYHARVSAQPVGGQPFAPSPECVARYAFLLAPQAGLQRHDLLGLAGDDDRPIGRAIWIDIRAGAAFGPV